jgi:hypothetical protein
MPNFNLSLIRTLDYIIIVFIKICNEYKLFLQWKTMSDLSYVALALLMPSQNYRCSPHTEECVEGIVEGFVPEDCPNFGTIQQR